MLIFFIISLKHRLASNLSHIILPNHSFYTIYLFFTIHFVICFHPKPQELDKITLSLQSWSPQVKLSLHYAPANKSSFFLLRLPFPASQSFRCTTHRPITTSFFDLDFNSPEVKVSLHYAPANHSSPFFKLQKLDKKITFSYGRDIIPASQSFRCTTHRPITALLS